MTTVTTPAKVARNLTRSFFEIGHKRCNSNDHISMSEICARELRATLLGNQPDWKPTHETAAWVHWYNTRRPHLALGGITPQQAENQHTTTRKEAASTSLHKTRDLTRRVRVRRPRVRRFRLDQPRDLTRRVRVRRPANTPAASSSCCKPPHCPIQDRCTWANLDGPIGECTGRPGRGCRGCRETGK